MKKVTIWGVALVVCSLFGARGFGEELKALHEHPTLKQMLFRNNELRRQMGLRPHRISPELTKAAQDHANYMAQTGSFSHYSNGGPFGRAIRHRFFGGGVRENIAMGQGNVSHVFNTWQNSGGHWASIVSNTSEAGFGYALGSGGTPYWVAVYGVGSTPAPKAEEGATTAAKTPAAPTPTTAYTTTSNSGRRLFFRRR